MLGEYPSEAVLDGFFLCSSPLNSKGSSRVILARNVIYLTQKWNHNVT
jgi:hypothetical protein